MPTADQSNILFKIAHYDLYEHNPFNVLNLPVSATAKDIRRRREDIEASFDAGTEADEFRDILPLNEGRKPPTREEVEDLFAALKAPEKRITYSLFWFWPEGETSSRRRSSNPNEAYQHEDTIRRWEDYAISHRQSESMVERHNLAVSHHLRSLSAERNGLRSASLPQVDKDWHDAIGWWNGLATDADFWHAVSERVSALGDPRLDYRLARSLRDQFAFAFDQINVELAIDYAKKDREADAKRQVTYMKLSQPGTDDVEGTFDDAFAGLLRQTEAMVNAALDEAKANPTEGLRQADTILAQTDEPLRVSRIVLEKGSSIRETIVSTIFGGVRGCLIAYGNKTEDWDECLKLSEKLKDIAETEEQLKQVDEDKRIIQENKNALDIQTHCWFCKQKLDDCNRDDYSVSLYGNLHTYHRPHGVVSSKIDYDKIAYDNFGKVFFSTKSINIPCCKQCHKNAKIGSHPVVSKLIAQGWHIGNAPSQWEINWVAKHGTEYSLKKEFKEDLEQFGAKIVLWGIGILFVGLIIGVAYIVNLLFKLLFNVDLGMF